MLTKNHFVLKIYKRLKIWLILKIFTVNNVEINFFVYKSESKPARLSGSRPSILLKTKYILLQFGDMHNSQCSKTRANRPITRRWNARR